MGRKLLLTFLWLLPLGLSSHSLRATSAVDLLVERPPQSLRGEDIDLDDQWASARLLAHFGESKRAYDVLRRYVSMGPFNPMIERFEVRLLTESGLYARADSLLALQPYTGDLTEYYKLCLQRARLNFVAGNATRALGFLSLIDTLSMPVYEPYKDYLAMLTLVDAGRYGEASDIGKKRLAKGIPVSLSPEFEQHLFDAYLGAGRYEDALDFIAVLKARRTRSTALAPVLVREVDLMFLMGDTLATVQSALNLSKDPQTRYLCTDVVEKVVTEIPSARMKDDALLQFSDVMLRANRLAEADRLIMALGDLHLSHGRSERRRLLTADLYYREKRYSKSYRLLGNKFSDASLERRAKLLRARIYRKTGQAVRSAEAYEQFAKAYPYDVIAAEALFVAADLYLRSNDRDKSMAVLARIMETYPSNRYALLATLRMASYYIDRRHYSRGIRLLELQLDRVGRRSPELLYYTADAYGKMGKSEKQARLLEELETLNPVSFYLYPEIEDAYTQPIMASNGSVALEGDRGLLEFLKRVFEQRQIAYNDIRALLDPVEDNQALVENRVYLERGRAFLQMGFRDWAELELRTLESSRKLSPRLDFELGVLYDDFAMHWKSVRAFQRVYYTLPSGTRRAHDGQFQLLMHPIPYPALVFENCARYKMAPHLVYAMIRQESRFEADAVSRAGAMGLMQLMPATGEQVAGRLGFPGDVEENLVVPEVNLTFGIWYASHLLERANDDPLTMLAAYNAGLGNARRWFNTRGSNDVIEMVDGIAYWETRDYVKRIVESAHIYHDCYFLDRPRAGRGMR